MRLELCSVVTNTHPALFAIGALFLIAAAGFTATAWAGSATQLNYVTGTGQSANTGTAVPGICCVQALDASNQPVAGVTVTWGSVTGGGSLTGAVQVTASNGVATLGGWTLGAIPGANSTTATSPGLPSVTFNATGIVVPPTITSNPADITVAVGNPWTFGVTASGSETLSYQWTLNTADIPGANSSSYTTPPTTLGDSGEVFAVRVSNTGGTVTSTNATLTVSAPVAPGITKQPADITAVVGLTASFSVGLSGTAPFTYQWKRGSSAITTGGTSATYTTPVLTLADDGATFSVTVTNSAGNITSTAATLRVHAANAPVITTQPQDVTVSAGNLANFSVVATGTPPLFFQWSRNGAPISGAVNQTYTFFGANAGDNNAVFAVTVTNGAGQVASNNATLTVIGGNAPAITTQPASITVTQGTVASFSVSASGDAPLSYQWLRNGVHIPGATSFVYTLLSPTLDDNLAAFAVAVGNPFGQVLSANAVLTVVSSSGDPAAPPQPTMPAGTGALKFSVKSSDLNGKKSHLTSSKIAIASLAGELPQKKGKPTFIGLSHFYLYVGNAVYAANVDTKGRITGPFGVTLAGGKSSAVNFKANGLDLIANLGLDLSTDGSKIAPESVALIAAQASGTSVVLFSGFGGSAIINYTVKKGTATAK